MTEAALGMHHTRVRCRVEGTAWGGPRGDLRSSPTAWG